MDLKAQLGFEDNTSVLPDYEDILPVIQLKLVATGFKPYPEAEPSPFTSLSADLIRKIYSKFRDFAAPLCPTDQRLQACLDRHFGDIKVPGGVKLPHHTLHMDFHGLARELSLPPNKDEFKSPLLSSYRIAQGVLHNPASDKRTTQGTFHVAEGGLPIPADKKAVPKETFARLFWHATRPPEDLKLLPFTSTLKKPVRSFTSLFLRPRVSPEVPGLSPYQDMEIRFFAPGSLISNLDFVESIFGNGGDPYLPENDPGLDVEHFCGISGMVLLAPHLIHLTKKELGLPPVAQATARQKRDGMCWHREDEKYNEGRAFKITFRTAEGVIITLLADNYFGYCKKEVKTQIGFAANLIGRCEEEHSGGALVFPSYNLGDSVQSSTAFIRVNGFTFKQVVRQLKDSVEVHPDGYAVDKKFANIIYLPEDANISLLEQRIEWKREGRDVVLRLLPENIYFYPSGYKVRMQKHPGASTWRLIGTVAEGTLCHKPSTVSGGGKSEISKSVSDGILYKNVYIQDLKKDFDQVDKILRKDFSDRFKTHAKRKAASRPFLSPLRSLGSVVRLLTPSKQYYTEEYNRWLRSIPPHVRTLAFLLKRSYRPEWGEDYRSHFSVDVLDGRPGNELMFHHQRLVSSYLKAGSDPDGSWMVFRLRTDYVPAEKLQVEDDITVSVVLPSPFEGGQTSFKFVENCEYRLFQRPDDAIIKGKDRQGEADLAGNARFISNFEPLPASKAKDMIEHAIEFEKFTEPMRQRILEVAKKNDGYFVSSDAPRIVDGKPTANVRYLQDRPDLVEPIDFYVAKTGMRLRRGLGSEEPVWQPVQAILIGRRNNPPDHKAKIKPLAVYNPVHYQELPEAFMDFIASLTGKSPSTTGAGSEGALTKSPFNALWAVHDLNNALVSYILTGLQVFSTPAGHVGSKYQVDHDLSLLIPEVWARMSPEERNADDLIEKGYLTRIENFTYNKKTIQAQRLGYRINERFLHAYFGRLFNDPTAVFHEDMLQPEKQSLRDFAEGVENIVEGHRQAALLYFEDGSVEAACPPLKALLHIMAYGDCDGLTASSPEFRKMFGRKELLGSNWYRERLLRQQQRDAAKWRNHIEYIKGFTSQTNNRTVSHQLHLAEQLKFAQKKLREVQQPGYLEKLIGTLGADAVGEVVIESHGPIPRQRKRGKVKS